jgi:hypothetical protein
LNYRLGGFHPRPTLLAGTAETELALSFILPENGNYKSCCSSRSLSPALSLSKVEKLIFGSLVYYWQRTATHPVGAHPYLRGLQPHAFARIMCLQQVLFNVEILLERAAIITPLCRTLALLCFALSRRRPLLHCALAPHTSFINLLHFTLEYALLFTESRRRRRGESQQQHTPRRYKCTCT